MNTLIYADVGVSMSSLRETLITFRQLFPSSSIKLISHKLVKTGGWENTTSLFIIPGGRDIPYNRYLKGEGTSLIKQFVKNGGKFVGICAGAYFAAAEVMFQKGTKLEVHEKRELQFFPGPAIGTLFPSRPFSYGLETGAHAPLIHIQEEVLPLYYNGGVIFQQSLHLISSKSSELMLTIRTKLLLFLVLLVKERQY